jgi:DNA-binding XRE family transcriptional regulator
MSNPAEKARAWREELGLTRAALAEKIGYAPETIYWFERFETPPGRAGKKKPQPIKPWVWLRYQRACEGLQREIEGRVFKW